MVLGSPFFALVSDPGLLSYQVILKMKAQFPPFLVNPAACFAVLMQADSQSGPLIRLVVTYPPGRVPTAFDMLLLGFAAPHPEDLSQPYKVALNIIPFRLVAGNPACSEFPYLVSRLCVQRIGYP